MSSDPEVLRGLADAIEVRLTLADGARGRCFEQKIEDLGAILYSHGKEIIAALRAPQKDEAAASEWRPIATAPQTSESILVAVSFPCAEEPEKRYVTISSYEDQPNRRGFRHRNGARAATHWQPLPAPPPDLTTEAQNAARTLSGEGGRADE